MPPVNPKIVVSVPLGREWIAEALEDYSRATRLSRSAIVLIALERLLRDAPAPADEKALAKIRKTAAAKANDPVILQNGIGSPNLNEPGPIALIGTAASDGVRSRPART